MSNAPDPSRSSPLLRRWPVAWVVAWRYILGHRSQVLSSTAIAAWFATTLGVMAMVIAMALMSGYTEDLQRKLIGLQGEIIAQPLVGDSFDESANELQRAENLAGVARMGRVAYGEGSLSSTAQPDGVGVVLRGIDPGHFPKVVQNSIDATTEWATEDLGITQGAATADAVPRVLIGEQLQSKLTAETGDVLRLVVLHLGDRVAFRYRSVRLAGVFSTGFAEFDSSWILMDRTILEKARGSSGIDVMEFELLPEVDAEAVALKLEDTLGSEWLVQRWETLNQPLFAALKLQEMLLFLVLGLIVLVSTFNIASTLVILVRERLADIGVLASLGLPPAQLRRIFVFYGMALGAAGTFCGVAFGSGIAWLITEFELVSFEPELAEVYFIDSVPFRVEALDLAAIITFSLLVTYLACSLPARRAARLLPSTALRHQ